MGLNAALSTPTVSETYDIDSIPTYSITRDDPNPSTASSLAFSVDFSEPVQNVDATDFALAKTGTANGDSLVEVSGSGSTYTVTIKNATGSGTLGLDLSGSQDITDLSDNALNTTATANEVYDLDAVAPTFSVVRDGPNPTNASPVFFSVDFSEDVVDVDRSDFEPVFTGSATGTAELGFWLLPSDDSTYRFAVNSVSGDGTVGLRPSSTFSITDGLGNTADTTPTENQVYNVDNTAPTLTEVAAIASLTYDNTPDYTFNTDEPGTIAVAGSCGTSSSLTVSAAGDVTITLTQSDNTSPLGDGLHSGLHSDGDGCVGPCLIRADHPRFYGG